jgi:hypothetical protein
MYGSVEAAQKAQIQHLLARNTTLKQQVAALSAATPERVNAMTQEWDEWAAENQGTRECFEACLRAAIKATPGDADAAEAAVFTADEKANAERFMVLAQRFRKAKTSECERILADLGLEGDVCAPLAYIIDQNRGVAATGLTQIPTERFQVLLDSIATLDRALQSMLDEDDGGLAAKQARLQLEQSRLQLRQVGFPA